LADVSNQSTPALVVTIRDLSQWDKCSIYTKLCI